MPTRTLVHVVDDDEAMRHSLEFLLRAAGFDVNLYDGAQPLLDKLQTPLAGCILTDIRMSSIDGLELLKRVKASNQPLPVVIMTGHGDVPAAVQAMKLGAADFIEKPFDEETLLKALAAAESESRKLRDPALEEFTRRVKTLSPRELQVFERLILGDVNKVIARRLDISPRTVEVFRAKIMAKLQASSLSELVRWAVQSGLNIKS